MGYDKTTWADDTMGVNAEDMSHLETQYAAAIAMADNHHFQRFHASFGADRKLSTVYQNSNSGPLFVSVLLYVITGSGASVCVSSSLTGGHPVDLVAKVASTNGTRQHSLQFLVPAGYYYEITYTGTVSGSWWNEIDLYEEAS